MRLPRSPGPRARRPAPAAVARARRLSPAAVARARRLSPAVARRAGSRRRLEPGRGGHAGLEETVAVVQADLHLEDQLHALVAGLDVLRRELRLGGDVGDVAAAALAVVGHHLRLLGETDARQVGLGDIDGEPGVGEIGDHAERRAGLQQLALLRHLLGDHAGQRAGHRRIPDLLLEGGGVGVHRGEPRPRLGDLLRPAAVAGARERLLRAAEPCRRHVAPRPRVVARLGRARAAVEQRLHAVEVLLGAVQVGAGAGDLGCRLGDVLRTRTGHAESQLGGRLVAVAACLAQGEEIVGGVELGQHLAELHRVPLLQRELQQPARDLGRDVHVGRFDVTRADDDVALGRLAAAGQQQRGGSDGRRHPGWPTTHACAIRSHLDSPPRSDMPISKCYNRAPRWPAHATAHPRSAAGRRGWRRDA